MHDIKTLPENKVSLSLNESISVSFNFSNIYETVFSSDPHLSSILNSVQIFVTLKSLCVSDSYKIKGMQKACKTKYIQRHQTAHHLLLKQML